MHQSFLDRWHDGTTGVRMERWNPDGALGERDGTMALLLAPGPRPPVRLPIRPSGPAQWRGAADAQLRAASGASKPNFDA